MTLSDSIPMVEIVDLLKVDIKAESPSSLVLSLPRRKHASVEARSKAQHIANLLYPSEDDLAALIRYERVIVDLRAKYLESTRKKEQEQWEAKGSAIREAVKNQGVYDYHKHTFDTPKALPMPVQIAQEEELKPFFEHLKSNRTFSDDELTFEPKFGIQMQEFRKGVVYEDRRMDLCKMVLGPKHIETLMECLSYNNEIKHFLLGNNIIGPNGARAIANYIQRHPNRMKTWYLAGNMIDAKAFALIADALKSSDQVSALWLKRNPLSSKSVDSLVTVLRSCHSLITLDLDQTELTGVGADLLFTQMRNLLPTLGLRTLYLNGNGIGMDGVHAIAEFLSSQDCRLENLYMANNPVADVGAHCLGKSLARNKSLKRLSLMSCGIGALGSALMAKRLTLHPSLIMLDLSQSFATKDLGSRFNYIEGELAFKHFHGLINQNPVMRCLDLGTTGFTVDQAVSLRTAASKSSTLWFFAVSSCHARTPKIKELTARLQHNVKRDHGITYKEFLNGGVFRQVRSPDDVRTIDSVYRNRDMALARSGQKVLDKLWDDTDDTMQKVIEYQSELPNESSPQYVK